MAATQKVAGDSVKKSVSPWSLKWTHPLFNLEGTIIFIVAFDKIILHTTEQWSDCTDFFCSGQREMIPPPSDG